MKIETSIRALALAATLALPACRETPQTPLADSRLLEMEADFMSTESVTYLFKADGVRSGRIESDTAWFFNDSSVVHLEGVDMVIYTDRGEVRATVTAEKGRLDQRTNQMLARGNVVLVMPNEGRQLESAELYYDPDGDRIWSDSASTFRNQGRVTRGTCFKSDLSFQNYEVCDIRGSAEIGG